LAEHKQIVLIISAVLMAPITYFTIKYINYLQNKLVLLDGLKMIFLIFKAVLIVFIYTILLSIYILYLLS
jgi:hypothetical protein